jgi:hypothetical protein
VIRDKEGSTRLVVVRTQPGTPACATAAGRADQQSLARISAAASSFNVVPLALAFRCAFAWAAVFPASLNRRDRYALAFKVNFDLHVYAGLFGRFEGPRYVDLFEGTARFAQGHPNYISLGRTARRRRSALLARFAASPGHIRPQRIFGGQCAIRGNS